MGYNEEYYLQRDILDYWTIGFITLSQTLQV